MIQRTERALWPEAAGIASAVVEAGVFSRATYRNVALPRWNDGPILFIGDAAHGTSRQLGQGANLALVDGWTLADVFGECPDIPSAIARFPERRGPILRFYRRSSHVLTPLFQSIVESFGWLRDASMGIACRLPVSRTIAATTLAGGSRVCAPVGCLPRVSIPKAATGWMPEPPGYRPRAARR